MKADGDSHDIGLGYKQWLFDGEGERQKMTVHFQMRLSLLESFRRPLRNRAKLLSYRINIYLYEELI